ncbi:hypothetical protein CEXT_618001 [Caerostris extrusa]|uniref:Uncharacterized protein n=1 Tax=Caerostris extrusa TaxID=172846 RepID=A0AAV4QWV8_CAEEX|nr:hypothetical protein CEXT_618001 [Caerostris extrusa]
MPTATSRLFLQSGWVLSDKSHDEEDCGERYTMEGVDMHLNWRVFLSSSKKSVIEGKWGEDKKGVFPLASSQVAFRKTHVQFVKQTRIFSFVWDPPKSSAANFVMGLKETAEGKKIVFKQQCCLSTRLRLKME